MFVFSRRDVNYEFLVHYRPCIYGEKLFRERGSPFQLSQLKQEYVWEKVHPFAWAKSWLLFILSLFERVDPAGQVKGPLPFSPKFRKILVRNQMEQTIWFGLTGVFGTTLEGGGVSGWGINTLNSGFGGMGCKPHLSCCFPRQGTLLHLISLHPGV